MSLTSFEQATVEQLVSYKIAKQEKESDESVRARIEEAMKSESLINEAKQLCKKWNDERVSKGLKPFE